MTSVSAVAPTKGGAPQVPNGNPFLDAMMAGEGGGAGGAPGGMDIGALMGMMGGGGAGGGGAPGGMDMSALMGMMGGGAGGGAPGGGMDIGALMGMMGGAGGPGGAPAGGAGGAGGGGGGGQMDMLTKILPYVPKILAFATKLPSFLCGYCIGLAALLLIHFVDPASILGLNSPSSTSTGAISTPTTTVGGVDEHVLYEDDEMMPSSSGFTDDLAASGGVGGGVGAALTTGFSYFAPQAGFYVVFIVLLTLVLPLYRRAKSIIDTAKYDVIRADSIAKEAKRKVAMKEHNAELD